MTLENQMLALTMNHQQWVCTACGYNMIGSMPDLCPFCRANRDKFLNWNKAEQIYRVTTYRVNDYVTQLISVPRLGIEHAAYRIETDDGAFWIDCPSVFNQDLEPVEAIYFTHRDFMGASNQYRKLWNAKVYLHVSDAEHPLAEQFPIDNLIYGDFTKHGIEAFYIGGHTPGFTIYIYDKVLFICDYAYPPGPSMQFNPYGPKNKTRKRASRILDLVSERSLDIVCGYNFFTDFSSWREDYKHLLDRNR